MRLALPLGFVMMLASLGTNVPRYVVEHRLGVRELGVFSAVSYIEGPYFGLPFSTIQTCQSDSSLTTGAYMILE